MVYRYLFCNLSKYPELTLCRGERMSRYNLYRKLRVSTKYFYRGRLIASIVDSMALNA